MAKAGQPNLSGRQPAKRGASRGEMFSRLKSIPDRDKVDLFNLFISVAASADDPEELRSAAHAMAEILAGTRASRGRLAMVVSREAPSSAPARPAELQRWIDFVRTRVVRVRQQRGWTQDQLAAKAGLPQSHISRIERGHLSPSHKTIQRLCKALGVPLSYLDPSVE